MEWIKVEDRLPKYGELVGYTFDGKNIRRDVYYPGFNKSWESVNSEGFYVSENNITHWIPIPGVPNALPILYNENWPTLHSEYPDFTRWIDKYLCVWEKREWGWKFIGSAKSNSANHILELVSHDCEHLSDIKFKPPS